MEYLRDEFCKKSSSFWLKRRQVVENDDGFHTKRNVVIQSIRREAKICEVLLKSDDFLSKNIHFLCKNIRFLPKNIHFLCEFVNVLSKNIQLLSENANVLCKNVQSRSKNTHLLCKNIKPLCLFIKTNFQLGFVDIRKKSAKVP